MNIYVNVNIYYIFYIYLHTDAIYIIVYTNIFEDNKKHGIKFQKRDPLEQTRM